MTKFPFRGVVRRAVGFVAVGTMLSALVTGCVRTGPVHGDPAPVTYLIPASVTHDCSTDVTADVLRFIDSVPDGPTPPSVMSATGATAGAPVVAFQPGACYRVEGTLLVRNRHNLFF